MTGQVVTYEVTITVVITSVRAALEVIVEAWVFELVVAGEFSLEEEPWALDVVWEGEFP